MNDNVKPIKHVNIHSMTTPLQDLLELSKFMHTRKVIGAKNNIILVMFEAFNSINLVLKEEPVQFTSLDLIGTICTETIERVQDIAAIALKEDDVAHII